MSLGIKLGVTLGGNGAVGGVVRIITAALRPATSPLTAGQSISDMTDFAAMIAPGNFDSSAGNVSSPVVTFQGVADATTPLTAGQIVSFTVTVGDDAGTTPRPFTTATLTVTGLARVVSATAGVLNVNTLPVTIDVADGTPDVLVAVGEFDLVGDGSPLLNRNIETGGENLVTFPVAKADDWIAVNATKLDLTLNAFGFLPGVEVTCNASWSGVNAALSGLVANEVRYGIALYRTIKVNPQVRVVLIDGAGNDTLLQGPAGNAALVGDTDAGTVTILAQEQRFVERDPTDNFDIVDHALVFEFTPTLTGDGIIRVGSNEGGEAIAVLGANLVDAVEPTSFITGVGPAGARPDAVATLALPAAVDGSYDLTLPVGLDAGLTVLATSPGNTAVVSDGPFPVDTTVPVSAGGIGDVTAFVGNQVNIDVASDFTGNNITLSLAPSSDAIPAGFSLSAGDLRGSSNTPFASTIVIRGTNPNGDFDDTAFQLAVVVPVIYDYPVTIDPAMVTSDLTNFPVQVRLDGAPQGFWDRINYQAGNVRAFVGETEVAFVASRVMGDTQVGEVSALLPNVSSTQPTTFILRVYEDKSMAPRDFEDALGAGSVYSGPYAAVVLGGHAPRNYGSVGGPVLTVGDALYFNRVGVDQTFAVNTHQGIAKDHATGWKFAIDTNRIDAFDENGVQQWSNANPAGDLRADKGTGFDVNHLCDGTVFGNWLLVPINDYVSANTPRTVAYLAVFDVATGAYITSTLLGGNVDISGVCWNPDINRLVACTFGVPFTQLDTYILDKVAGTVTLGSPLPITATQADPNVPLVTNIQGIEYAWGGYYIANDPGPRGNILRMEVTPSGVTYDSSCYVAVETIAAGNSEGLTRDGDSLLWLIDPTGGDPSYTVKFAPASVDTAGGAVYTPLDGNNAFEVHGLSVGNTDTWSLSAVGKPETNRQSVVAGLRLLGTSGDVRLGLAHRGGNRADTWKSGGGSWANPSPTITFSATGTAEQQERHLAVVHTTDTRRFYVDGGLVDTDNPSAPVADTMDVLTIGREDTSGLERHHGLTGGVKLAMSDLGADFLSAEHNMLHNPSFATIGALIPKGIGTMAIGSTFIVR